MTQNTCPRDSRFPDSRRAFLITLAPTSLAPGPHDQLRDHYLIPVGATGFPMSQDPRPRDPQYPDSRLSPDARHASLGSTAYDGVGNSHIAVL
jgi:hypothetical protein